MLCSVTHSCLALWDPMDCTLPGSSVHGDSPGMNPGVGSHAVLQGIFLGKHKSYPEQHFCLVDWWCNLERLDKVHINVCWKCFYENIFKYTNGWEKLVSLSSSDFSPSLPIQEKKKNKNLVLNPLRVLENVYHKYHLEWYKSHRTCVCTC